MGPIIILDKSVLQTLSFKEIDFLYRYFLVNVTPVLIAEIQGDLSKADKEGKPVTEQVVRLASKIPQVTSAVNFQLRDLILNSLMGTMVPMNGQIPVFGGRLMRDQQDELGAVMQETPEERAIQRWRDGDFSPGDVADGRYWREVTRSFDYGPIFESFEPLVSSLPVAASLQDVKKHVDLLLMFPDMQSDLLDMIMDEFPVGAALRGKVRERWRKEGEPAIARFAPYAFYCFRVVWTFYAGIAKKVIGARPTNMVDLEYVFYLPFSQVFASSDKFHKTFTPLFQRMDQTFVWGDDLRASLKHVVTTWDALHSDDRPAWLKVNGRYPPDEPDLLLTQLWRQHCRYRPPGEKEPTEAERARTLAMLQRRSAGLRPAGEDVPQLGDDPPELMFLERTRTVHADDPCPCRSGQKFSDCHLPLIKEQR